MYRCALPDFDIRLLFQFLLFHVRFSGSLVNCPSRTGLKKPALLFHILLYLGIKIQRNKRVFFRKSNRLKYRCGSGSGLRNFIFNGSVQVQIQDFSKIWVQVRFGFSGTKI